MAEKQRQTKAATREAAWAVRGVSPETQNAVRMAARRAGQTLGQWVDARLLAAATAELRGPSTAVGPTQDQIMARVLELMERQDTRLAALETAAAQQPARGWLARLIGR